MSWNDSLGDTSMQAKKFHSEMLLISEPRVRFRSVSLFNCARCACWAWVGLAYRWWSTLGPAPDLRSWQTWPGSNRSTPGQHKFVCCWIIDHKGQSQRNALLYVLSHLQLLTTMRKVHCNSFTFFDFLGLPMMPSFSLFIPEVRMCAGFISRVLFFAPDGRNTELCTEQKDTSAG